MQVVFSFFHCMKRPILSGILFLLPPDFADPAFSKTDSYFCPSCAMVEGFLSYFPQVREKLIFEYLDFPRPRKVLVERLGEARQSCPVLILGPDAPFTENLDSVEGGFVIQDATEITRYLGKVFGLSLPHP